MTHPTLTTNRFTTDTGNRITVQVPADCLQTVVDAVQTIDPLTYGDYDSVTFQTAAGIQTFRALGTGRNAATDGVVTVPCVELSCFVTGTDTHLTHVLERIYWAHPYEEPVIFAVQCLRTCHIRGQDVDNSNRFWNEKTPDWVPDAHRQLRACAPIRRFDQCNLQKSGMYGMCTACVRDVTGGVWPQMVQSDPCGVQGSNSHAKAPSR